MSDCFNAYSDAYYCNANGTRYCCKTSVSTSVSVCFTNEVDSIDCSNSYTSSELLYSNCALSPQCSNSTKDATLDTGYVYVWGPAYSEQYVCFYDISADSQLAVMYEYIHLRFDFFFACTVNVVNGISKDAASNITKPEFDVDYYFPTLGTGE